MEDEDEGRQQSRTPPGLRAWHWLGSGDGKTGATGKQTGFHSEHALAIPVRRP